MGIYNKPELAGIKAIESEKAERDAKSAERDAKSAERDAKSAERDAKLSKIAKRLEKPEYKAIFDKAFPNGGFDAGIPEHLATLEKAFSDPSLRKELFDAARENDAKSGGTDLRFFASQFHSLGLIDTKELDSILRSSVPPSPSDGKKPGDVRLAAAEGFRKADPDTFVALDRKDPQGRAFDEIIRKNPDGSLSKTIASPKSGYSLDVPVSADTLPNAQKETELTARLDGANHQSERVAKWRGDLKELEMLRERSKSGEPLSEESSKRLDELAKLEAALKERGIDGDAGLEAFEKEKIEPERHRIEKELAVLRMGALERAAKPENAASREALARDVIALFDSIGLTQFAGGDVERLLSSLPSSEGAVDNGRPTDLERLIDRKSSLASEFREFAASALDARESDLFDMDRVPPSLKSVDADGKPLNLRSEFVKRGLCREDGTVDWSRT